MSDQRSGSGEENDAEQRAEHLADGAQSDTAPPSPGEDTDAGGGPEQPNE
jgi:hypothetical protein